jgi:hypothetical protein
MENLYGNIAHALPGLKFGISSDMESFAAGENIYPGDPLFGMIGDDKVCYGAHLSAISLTASADLVTSNIISVTVNGVTLSSITFEDSSAQTIKKIVNAIDQSQEIRALGIDAFYKAESPRAIFLQGPGVAVTASATVTGGASQATFSSAPYGQFKFIGVAALEQLPYGKEVGYYPTATSVGVLARGKIHIRVADSAHPDDKKSAYIIMSGADAGKFTDASGGGNYDCGCLFRSGRIENELAMIEVMGMK